MLQRHLLARNWWRAGDRGQCVCSDFSCLQTICTCLHMFSWFAILYAAVYIPSVIAGFSPILQTQPQILNCSVLYQDVQNLVLRFRHGWRWQEKHCHKSGNILLFWHLRSNAVSDWSNRKKGERWLNYSTSVITIAWLLFVSLLLKTAINTACKGHSKLARPFRNVSCNVFTPVLKDTSTWNLQ